jgi:hypothetical protein
MTLKTVTTMLVVSARHGGHYAGAISTSVEILMFATLWLAGDDRAA